MTVARTLTETIAAGLAEAVLDLREQAGMSRQDLARAAGMAVSSLAALERGECHSLPLYRLWALAAALGVPPIVLFHRLNKEVDR